MKHRHNKSQQNYTINGCYTTVLTAVAPILIYFLQLFGKVSTLAACAAGVLIISKALIEWRVAMQRIARQQQPTSPLAPTHHQKKPTPRLVSYHPPVAGCYFCKEVRPLRAYASEGQSVGTCQDCYCTLSRTRHRV